MVGPQGTYEAGPNGNEVLGPNPGTNILTTSHIYLHLPHKNQPNVGKYTGPMDPMGHEWFIFIGTYTVPPIGSDKGMVLMVLTVEIMSY